MSKIVNLRQVRKSRARDEKRAKAQEAAARHGRSKSERSSQTARTEKSDAHLDGHRLEEEDE